MKAVAKAGLPAAKFLLPTMAFLIALAARPSAAANSGVALEPYDFGLKAYIFGHSSAMPLSLPENLVDGAINQTGDVQVTGISGFFNVDNLTRFKAAFGHEEVHADGAFGWEVGSLQVLANTAIGPLAEYTRGGPAGAVTAITKSVGSNLSGTLLRPDGTYHDFPLVYSKGSPVKRGIWAWTNDFTTFFPQGIGVVTTDSAFRVIQAGDPVPDLTGETFTQVDNFTLGLSVSWAAYKGRFSSGHGLFVQRFSDKLHISVALSLSSDPDNPGEITGAYFPNDNEIVYGTAGKGIFKRNVLTWDPPEIILPNNTDRTGVHFGSGTLHHGYGDYVVIAGISENAQSTIFYYNVVTDELIDAAHQGEEIPQGNGTNRFGPNYGQAAPAAPGDTFSVVQRPGVSDKMIVFEGFNQNFQLAGIFARRLDTWELERVLGVGDIFDGREVRTIAFYPGAVAGDVVGFVVYFTDNSSGAYLATMNYGFSVPALNISTRFGIGEGDDAVGIGGFINVENTAIGVSAPLASTKKVIIRAIGPSLGGAGLANPLADPVLELHFPDGSVVTNDNWRDTQEQDIIDSNIPPTDDLESAIVATLDPGAYTAIVRGKNGGTGTGLVEIYDLDGPATSELANISTRSLVQTGDDVMIGGVIIGGDAGTGTTVVLRAIGPSLAAMGVAGALEDPVLELHDSTGALIASNDDWKETQQALLEASQLAPTDDRESALQIALTPGAYTAIVLGKNGTTGIGLVEAYNLEASGPPASARKVTYSKL